MMKANCLLALPETSLLVGLIVLKLGKNGWEVVIAISHHRWIKTIGAYAQGIISNME
jgi:hypothetical protein